MAFAAYHLSKRQEEAERKRRPKTTETCIIFPFGGGGFEADLYNTHHTDGRASPEEINTVLTEVYTIKKFDLFDPELCERNIWRILNFVFALVALIIIVFFWGITSESNKPLYYAVSLCILAFICKKKDQLLTEKALKDVIDKHNDKFASRKLRWHLPNYNPKWVELWKDYKIDQPGEVALNDFAQGQNEPLLQAA